MPLFKYKCKDCNTVKEHFVQNSRVCLECPECNSKEYKKTLSKIKLNMEYSNSKDHFEKKIQPHVNDVYSKMGKEALNEDTQTAENYFGAEKVGKTFTKNDES